MLVSLWRDYESCGTEFSGRVESVISSPGDDPKSREVPSFLRQAIEALRIPEADSEKSRPVGLNKDLVLEPSLASLFFAEVMRRTWFALVKSSPETLLEQVEELKGNVGVSPIYDSVYTVCEMSRAKYKPVVRKVVPISTQDPDAPILEY